MKCASCGAENSPEVNFCKGCGKPLKQTMVSGGPSGKGNQQDSAEVPFKRGTKAETWAFVLGIIAIVLHFVPVPLLCWFCIPCAVVGFMAAVIEGQSSRVSAAPYSGRVIVGFLLCAYVLALSLLGAIGLEAAQAQGGTDLLNSVIDLLSSMS